MYKNILVPIASDHDPSSPKAIAAARLLADGDARITVLTVMEAVPEYVAQQLPKGQLAHNAIEIAKGLRAELEGQDDIVVEVVEGHSGRTILEWAEEHGVDCIVMASHRPGLSDYFLGSTAARVVRHATCAVHVMR
ncbi:universal stress protein [Shimia thalassica]|jgi:nucleotide-binding universal stress UspA family protein|uniref:Universal stress protein F n=1 Tax=Shimia thalassica TaxID=1715693 RepID=A0A0N7M9H4_9RHOB|nr:universal stress protein [Shimia thalassica]PHO02515.1 universal stress protein [Rhodobacteraceae bacterium 4F10]MDO6479947.1 universal stress protein [Shimia thalassica]MDO6483206.1 universal stress protein [Shimia thalassica]MDO6520882.1 universal stress protein [Shimia thalassica]MDP2495089.1 universal stress protein [Shimia thalassica]